MEIIVGKESGFCAGVKFTIEKAEKLLEEHHPIYCVGEIVHNERVVENLEKKGLKTGKSIDEIPEYSKVIIRAHGETKDFYESCKKKHCEVFDLTCGKVSFIHHKIEKNKKDSFIIILGKKNHPETIGSKSFASISSAVIETKEDIHEVIQKANDSRKKSCYIVAQTTFSSQLFDEIVKELKKGIQKEIVIDKTICNATEKRQEETALLAQKVDAMIIIGGKNSSNTKELYEISKKYLENVTLIQDARDLKPIKKNRVGIMAGASTPSIVVEEVIKKLKGEVL